MGPGAAPQPEKGALLVPRGGRRPIVPGGRGEWAVHTPPPRSIDLSKVQARDELSVGSRLLPRRAELRLGGARKWGLQPEVGQGPGNSFLVKAGIQRRAPAPQLSPKH